MIFFSIQFKVSYTNTYIFNIDLVFKTLFASIAIASYNRLCDGVMFKTPVFSK